MGQAGRADHGHRLLGWIYLQLDCIKVLSVGTIVWFCYVQRLYYTYVYVYLKSYVHDYPA